MHSERDVFRRGEHTLVVVGIAIAALGAACGAPKRRKLDDVSTTLHLTDAQLRVMEPAVARARGIVEDYEADKKALMEQMPSPAAGGRGSGRGAQGGDS